MFHFLDEFDFIDNLKISHFPFPPLHKLKVPQYLYYAVEPEELVHQLQNTSKAKCLNSFKKN